MRTCRQCGRKLPLTDNRTFCSCGGVFDDFVVNIMGTRDSFGIKKEFFDPQTGKTIDSWKKWEKAGFRQVGDVKDHRNPEVKEKAKWFAKRKPKQTKCPAVDFAERI